MVDDIGSRVVPALERGWWLAVVRGLLLVVLGLVLVAQPSASIDALVWLFGIFAIADGFVAIFQAVLDRGRPGWGWSVVDGAAGLVIGTTVVAWPGPTVRVLFALLAVWLLVLGIASLLAAAGLWRFRDPAWVWSFTTGLVLTLFAVLLLARPEESVGAFGVVLGLFAFAAGALGIVSGVALRSVVRRVREDREELDDLDGIDDLGDLER